MKNLSAFAVLLLKCSPTYSFVPSKTPSSQQFSLHVSSIPLIVAGEESDKIGMIQTDQQEESINVPLMTHLVQQELTVIAGTALMAVITSFDIPMEWSRMIFPESLLTAMLLIAGQTLIQQLPFRTIHEAAFDEEYRMMSLFGRRSRALDVAAYSGGLALVSSATQELVLRGIFLTCLYGVSGDWMITMATQAAMSGFVSHDPKQSWNGLVLGAATALSGSLFPAILGRFMFEWHQQTSTWQSIRSQLDWSDEQSMQQHDALESLPLETQRSLTEFFYAFDSHHSGSLSTSDVQKAVTFAFLGEEQKPSTRQVFETIGERQSLDLGEFVDVLLKLRQSTQSA